MKTRSTSIWFALLIMLALTTISIWPVAARETQPEAAGQSVMLRLKYATFDPLQGEPKLPPVLHTDAHRGTGEGAYIVQFNGPIQEAWTDQVRALGGRVMDYLPDFAYLVWMDGATREQVAALDTVRWVGLYQPAYKLSPNLDRTKSIYRVVLFEGADLDAVSAKLADLNTPTRQVAGEQFTLLLPEGGVDQVANWPEVLWIENRPAYRLHNDVATGIMGAPTAWDSGYTGAGQKVTVADTGIHSGVDDSTMHPDFRGRFDAIYDWSDFGSDPCGGCSCEIIPDGAMDTHGHGTHVLGSVLGNGAASGGSIKGPAYEAEPTFQAVGQYVDYDLHCDPAYYPDGVYLLGLPDDLGELFLQAYQGGRYIHSNSWGAAWNGEYTIDSQAVDQFVWGHPEMLILFSAGNGGTDKSPKDGYVDTDSLDSPGTAKNAVTVGASDNLRSSGGYNPGGLCYTWGACWPNDFQVIPTSTDYLSDNTGEMAAFSGRGPTNDDRLKPDVVAPGTNILSTRSPYGAGGEWGPYNYYYEYMGGSSMATPLVAGASALVRQYYVEGLGHTDPSAALLKATLINSAVDVPGYGNASKEAGLPIPNNHEGWGRVDIGTATSGERHFVDGTVVRFNQTIPYVYDVGYSGTPFKITLAWSDYPASVSAGGLVDDLDLVVTAPDGTTYYGNHFSGGWSVPGYSPDRLNNVEAVYIQSPAVGEWTVRVTGYNVPAPGGQQPFALVVTFASTPPPPPVAAFSGSPTSGERPLEVSFTDESTGEITGWLWDFGDNGSSTAPNPTHTYEEAGDYTVSLTVIGPGGPDTETKLDYIHVSPPPPPVAAFSGSPTSGEMPLEVSFADESTGEITDWLWDFGDDGSSTVPNPTHTYEEAGDYTVSLTVTGPGGPDTETKLNYIHVSPPPPPVAAFSGSPTSGETPLEVRFTDESTGVITGWSWDFGDMGSSTAPNPTHTYEAAGDYAVSLTVTGPGGSDTETKDAYIQVIDLQVDHTTGAPGSHFVFTGQNFTPGADATVSVNGTDLAGTVPVDGTGTVVFALLTADTMSPGRYFVTVRTNPSALTYFDLDPDGDLWPDPGTDPTIEVPDTIEPARRVYLPQVMRGYTTRDAPQP